MDRGPLIGQNTFENTPEDNLGTFCNITSRNIVKTSSELFGTSKITGPNRSGL